MSEVYSYQFWSKRVLGIVFFLFAFLLNTSAFSQSNDLDMTFDPGTGVGGFMNYAKAVALQADGKILLGGAFESFNGVDRSRIVRLHEDGEVDLSFDPGTGVFTSGSSGNPQVKAIQILDDGKILIGGEFSLYNGIARNGIARLNSDGSLDESFNAGLIQGALNTAVNCIEVQDDGKILIGGNFFSIGGVSRKACARLNSNGSLDTSFDPGFGFTGSFNALIQVEVNAIAIQLDDKIILSGNFTSYNAISNRGVVRVDASGAVDDSFDVGTGPDNVVQGHALQSDGKVVIVGDFLNVNGESNRQVCRLNMDGSIDTGFSSGTSVGFGQLFSVILDSDERILIGGGFNEYNGTTIRGVARLNSNGTLDSYDAGAGMSDVKGLAFQSDGKLLVCGGIVYYSEALTLRGIVRLNMVGVTNIESLMGNKSISIYPNPAAETLNISSELNSYTINIVSILGQIAQRHNCYSGNCQIDISNLLKGLYLVQVMDAGDVIHEQKIIRQ